MLFALAKAPPDRCPFGGEERRAGHTHRTALSNMHASSRHGLEDQTYAWRGKFVELLEGSQQPTSARVRKMSQRWIHPAQLELGQTTGLALSPKWTSAKRDF